MGVVIGTGYAGPGWEWPKAGHRQHLDHQVDVPHLKAKAKVVSGAIGRNFPYWDQTAEAPLWGAHSKPHPMGADIYVRSGNAALKRLLTHICTWARAKPEIH